MYLDQNDEANDTYCLPVSVQRFSKMTHDSLIAYWYAQSLEMRAALLAFWRNAATCPHASQALFAGVVATLQRLKNVHSVVTAR